MSSSFPQGTQLPALRDDLQIVKGIPTIQGDPTWTIIDPIKNTYFQVGWGVYQMLARWEAGTTEELLHRVSSETTYTITQQNIEELLHFLYTNHLTQAPPSGGSSTFFAQSEAGKQHWLSALVHHYLFVKIPIARPDRLLKRTLPFIRPIMTSRSAFVVLLIGIVGMYLVSRQWDTFTSTFLHMFSLEGMAEFGLAFCGVKFMHELGHAYTATNYGCRVHTMGVAFIVMFPVLYTDTTDAWRLTSRRERLFIAAAGIITELAVAVCATFLWNFLPDGIVRSIAFVLATTSWMMSLAINLNPLLRFDGYYLLSDLLGIPNLQQRAFAFGRWKLREWLFGIGIHPPEQLASRLRTTLITYAWSVWVFRLFLVIGVAVLVYYVFFKVLGIVLFMIEIVWFILMPLTQEGKEWWKLRNQIWRQPRTWVSATGLVLGLVVLCIPWNIRVAIPAILQAQEHTTIYAPAPAQFVEVSLKNGQHVEKGEVLARLISPHIEQAILATQTRLESLTQQLRSLVGDEERLAEGHILHEELNAQTSKLKGLYEMENNLELRAPFEGMVVDVQRSLHQDRWVNEELPLARIIQPSNLELIALTPGTELMHLQVGREGYFIPDDPMRPTSRALIKDIREVSEETLMIPYLASVFGGNIPVRKDQDGRLIPEAAMYRVTLQPQNPTVQSKQIIKGVIHIHGNPQSLVERMWNDVFANLMKEMGF